MTALADIRDLDAGVAYPGPVLKDSETALVLFAAGFLGKQDAYWIAEAGLTATCVDTDTAKLEQMEAMYPDDWEYVAADAYQFGAETERQWDIVSLDPWTQDFQRCADHLQLWCDLANRAVILGIGWDTKFDVPDGWQITDMRKRSDYKGGVGWLVLEPT